MKISTLKNILLSYFENKLDSALFFDPNNNPFVNVSINYCESGEWKEESVSAFIRLEGKKPSSTFSYPECLSISKVLQATYLESKKSGSEGEKKRLRLLFRHYGKRQLLHYHIYRRQPKRLRPRLYQSQKQSRNSLPPYLKKGVKKCQK